MAGTRDELGERRAGYRSRRPLLADAAIAVLARDGGRGLTHRAVDREAHVPEGTTKNYHPTRQSLLEAVAARMADTHRAALDRLRETTPAKHTSLRSMTEQPKPASTRSTPVDHSELIATTVQDHGGHTG